MRCHSCKRQIHGKCCTPQINKTQALHYKNNAFFCDPCSKKANFEDSVHIPDDEVANSSNVSCSKCDCHHEIVLLKAELASLKEKVLKNTHFMEQKEKHIKFWDNELEKRKDEISKICNDLKTKTKNFQPTTRKPQSDIMVFNIPEFENENTLEIASEILAALDDNIQKDEISSVKRIPTARSPPIIKITMKTTGACVKAVSAAKIKKMKVTDLLKHSNIRKKFKDGELAVSSVDDLHVSATTPLIVDHPSSKSTRVVLSKALQLKRDGHLSSAWVFRDTVFYKLNQTSPKIRARSIKDLPTGPTKEQTESEMEKSQESGEINPLDVGSIDLTESVTI